MGWDNGVAPNSGLGGTPVGISLPPAYALLAKGLKPFLASSNPVDVKIPHLNRSRLVIWPWESALTISARLSRAFCASLRRALDALRDKYILLLPFHVTYRFFT
jgi:hypothetical protein